MSRFHPHFAHAPKVFEAAQAFKQRCLLDQKSLFVPKESIWTGQHFQVLVEKYVQSPDDSDLGFYEKLEHQLSTCSPLDVVLMTELFWLIQLGPTNLKAQTKIDALKRIWNIKPPFEFPSDSEFLAIPVLSGLGSAGPGHNNYIWREVSFAVQAFGDFSKRPLSERQALLSNAYDFAMWLDSVPSGKGRQLYHTLCHLLFPDEFERIFSQGHKNKVARHFKVWTSNLKDSRPALDKVLLELRERLEVEHTGAGVDYYAPPVGTLLVASDEKVLSKESTPTSLQAEEPGVDYVTDVITAVTPKLRKVENVILYGPPGTGKTFELQSRQQRTFDDGEEYEFVTFHPSYSYEDFVGGLRPIAAQNGTGIAVKFEKGPFYRICDRAHENPMQYFTLFIDEINRANVAKVFGELITLIEPSKRVVAGSKPSEKGAWVTLPGNNEKFGVPDNLNIVATMNTADRSIAMMDLALRRRFDFVECRPDASKIDPATVGKIDICQLMGTINDRLEFLLDRDHTIGHAHFIGLDNLGDVQTVLAKRVIPLLQEYFFEDLEKVKLVLTGSMKKSKFLSSRRLVPTTLFPGGKSDVGSEARLAFSVGDPASWLEEDIVGLYSNVGDTGATGALGDDSAPPKADTIAVAGNT